MYLDINDDASFFLNGQKYLNIITSFVLAKNIATIVNLFNKNH